MEEYRRLKNRWKESQFQELEEVLRLDGIELSYEEMMDVVDAYDDVKNMSDRE